MRFPLEKPVTPSDPPVQWCEAEGRLLSYTDEGPAKAPALVLVHGVPGSVTDFRYLAPLLCQQFRVIRLEFPGFGSNYRAAGERPYPATPEARARIILACASALGIETFCVVGHSMGGPAAMTTAALAPERVRALGLIASVGLRRHRGMVVPPWVMQVNVGLLRVPGLARPLVKTTRRAYARMGFRKGTEALTRDEIEIHARIIGAIKFTELRQLPSQITCKTVVTAAVDDRLIEPEIPREMAQEFTDARSMIFPSGGHNIQKSRARAIAALLTEAYTAALRECS